MELITYDLTEPRQRYPGRRGIYPEVVDLDDVFRRLDIPPVMVNDIDLTTEQGQARFNEMVYTKYDGDVFSNVPSCPCRHWWGGHRVGEKCPKCGYACLPITEQTIEPIVWVRVPDMIPYFMNITVYSILKESFMKNGFNAIDWFMDPKYRPLKDDTPEERMVKRLGYARGMTCFNKNFAGIMEGLCSLRRFITKKDAFILQRFLDMYKDLIWCKHLPFPSKIGFVVEGVGDRVYVDDMMAPAINALVALAKAARATRSSRTDIESSVAKSQSKLDQYYKDTEQKKLFDKPGVSRRLVFGTSPYWSFRTVITSKHVPHDHETIDIPWGAAVLTFKLHITNKLLKEDYTPNQINSLIYDNVLRTHYKLERIFDELIEESPGSRGPTCMLTRFPSLMRNSSTRYYIKVKRDARDRSTSVSTISLVAANADFDGDYMTGQLALDNWAASYYDRHAAKNGLMDLGHPFRVSNHSSIPSPTLTTINSRVEEGDDISVEMFD